MIASPPTTDAAPSSASPAMNSRLRPSRSATRPKNRVNDAAHTANAVTIHWSDAVSNPSSRPIGGSATLRIEKSTARVKFAVRRTPMASACDGVKRSAAGGAVAGRVESV